MAPPGARGCVAQFGWWRGTRRRTTVRAHLNLAARLTLASLLALIAPVPQAGATGPAQATPAAAPAAVTPTAFVPGNIHLSFARVAHGLSQPVFATTALADSSRLFVVEQSGLSRLIRKGVLQSAPFLDLRAKISTGGERGLLGLAFPPDYNTNGKFYVDYTDRNGNTVVE